MASSFGEGVSGIRITGGISRAPDARKTPLERQTGEQEGQVEMGWNPHFAIAVFIGLTATVEDLIRREIPNWIPVTALLGGLAASIWLWGWSGLGSSLLGSVLGFLVFLIFYLLGGMGGGDVKLMAGLGAVLGAGRILEAALWTAGLGGVMAALAVGYAAMRSRVRPSGEPASGKSSLHIPYAPAIALGASLALLPAS